MSTLSRTLQTKHTAGCAFVSARPAVCFPSRTACVARSSTDSSASAAPAITKRELLLGVAGLGVASCISVPSPAIADGEVATSEYSTFLGYASPPTSYGGYGGNAKEDAKYTFEYPAGWKRDQPNKVEKGTQGIDGRVVNPRAKDQRAFVITLGRAGEDNKSFRLVDLDSTVMGFAGADYNLQDAISAATSKVTTDRVVDGVQIYDYDIDSPEYHYLASITVKQGKVFGLFVRSPAKTFKANETKLRHIISSFKLL